MTTQLQLIIIIIIIIIIISLRNTWVYHELNASCKTGTVKATPLTETVATGHDPELPELP